MIIIIHYWGEDGDYSSTEQGMSTDPLQGQQV